MGCPVIPAATVNRTHDAVFDKGTPLLYYVLAEAERGTAHSDALERASSRRSSFARCGTPRLDPPQRVHAQSAVLIHIDPRKKRFSFGDLLVDTGIAPRLS